MVQSLAAIFPAFFLIRFNELGKVSQIFMYLASGILLALTHYLSESSERNKFLKLRNLEFNIQSMRHLLMNSPFAQSQVQINQVNQSIEPIASSQKFLKVLELTDPAQINDTFKNIFVISREEKPQNFRDCLIYWKKNKQAIRSSWKNSLHSLIQKKINLNYSGEEHQPRSALHSPKRTSAGGVLIPSTNNNDQSPQGVFAQADQDFSHHKLVLCNDSTQEEIFFDLFLSNYQLDALDPLQRVASLQLKKIKRDKNTNLINHTIQAQKFILKICKSVKPFAAEQHAIRYAYEIGNVYYHSLG